MKPTHFLALKDFDAELLHYLLHRGIELKRRFKAKEEYLPMKNRVLAMLFEKASTRTRVSFEAGFDQMGGSVIYLNNSTTQLHNHESMADTARVVSRMVDIVMVRTSDQSRIQEFAENSLVPVINGLTNENHPCQIMGDIMTFIEKKGPINGAIVTWIGDANNVLYSWLQAAAILDFQVHIYAPVGFKIDPKRMPKASCYKFFLTPEEAAKDADLVTTDNWQSTGYTEKQTKRVASSARWQVNNNIMSCAKPDALFMHCLPAYRGKEVSSEVLDGPQSVVWEEGENRLHIQKAIMEYLLLGKISD